jgi:hypothetical protein
MDVTKPYEFIGFGTMDVTKPYEFIGFGAMDVSNPYEFKGFGAIFSTLGMRFGPTSAVQLGSGAQQRFRKLLRPGRPSTPWGGSGEAPGGRLLTTPVSAK